MHSSRVLEQQVSCGRVGEFPPEPAAEPERGPERRRVAFDMQATDLEILRQALGLMRAQLELDAAEVDDGVLLAELARPFIQKQSEPAEPATGERYRVVIQSCPDCGDARAPLDDVSDTVAAEVACDAEVIDMRPGPTQGHTSRVIAPLLRKKLLNRANWRCEVPGFCGRLWLDVHHLCARADGGGNEPRNLVVLYSGHHPTVHAGGLALERGTDDSLTVTHRNGSSRRATCPAEATR